MRWGKNGGFTIANIGADKLIQSEANDIKVHCRSVSTQTINQSSESVTHLVVGHQCAGGENQSLLTKAFNGEYAVYSVSYTIVQGKVSGDESRVVSSVIKNSYLIPNPNY